MFVVVNIFFLRAALRNPGYKDPVKSLKFDKLVEKYDPQAVCPNCETIYEKDSRHCYICDKCVDKYDHHCQWINNCVGKNNHLSFYLYITSLMMYFMYIDALFFINLEAKISQEIGETSNQMEKSLIFGVDQVESAQYWLEFVLYEILIIVNLFLPPLMYLVYV